MLPILHLPGANWTAAAVLQHSSGADQEVSVRRRSMTSNWSNSNVRGQPAGFDSTLVGLNLFTSQPPQLPQDTLG